MGKALILDHSVNRPNSVMYYFGEALNRFYEKYPDASLSPSEWGANREEYENWIIECYGPLRDETLSIFPYPMGDGVKRFNNLKNHLES